MSTGNRQAQTDGLIAGTVHGPSNGGNFEHEWQGDYLEAFCVSDVGKKRKKNEDGCLVSAPEDVALVRSRGMLFAVADGMGGASAGEFASRLALCQMARAYYNGLSGTTPAALRSAVEIANQKVHEEAELNPVYAGMGTTVSAVIVHGPWAYIAQVGDSRVYLVRNGTGIHQLTNDHSLVAEQVRCGLITEDEARHHALKNLITRAVGIKDTVNVDLFGLHLEEGDTLLICSDGLSNVVSDSYLEQTLSLGNLKLAARRLVNKALEEGGPDNITALVVRVRHTPPETELETGAQMVDIQPKTLLTRIKKFFV